MKFNDLMAFVKAGYKPNEVKELLAIQTESEEDPPADDKKEEPEEKEPETEPVKEEPKEDEEINLLKDKINTLEAQLKSAQDFNRTKPAEQTTQKTEEEQLEDIVQGFIN